MKAEAAFLLELARGEAGPGPAVHDPHRLLGLAQDHQVDALCSVRLQQGDPALAARCTEDTRQAFRMSYLHHTVRNEVLLQDLGDVAEALGRRGIEFLVFKGPWLALAAWPEPGTRPIDDIDLGVREQDYAGAVEALREVGYAPDRPLPEGPDGPEAALRQAHFGEQLRFLAPGRRVLELHFRMINVGPPSDDEAWIWQSARSLDVGTTAIRVPGDEAMLLHLALHANQHAFTVLRLLFDLRFALERSEPEPGRFLERVRSLRCSASVYHALVLAQELAGARPPAELVDALRPGRMRRAMFRRAWNLPGVRELEASKRSTSIESPLLYLLEMGGPRDKARYVAGMVRQAGGARRFLRSATGALRSSRKPSPVRSGVH